MKIIDSTLLNTVSEQAKTNSRLRMNYNFHKHMDEPVHLHFCLMTKAQLHKSTRLTLLKVFSVWK